MPNPSMPGAMTGSKCSQCGYAHPPILDGSDCPMKKPQTKSGQELDMTKLFQHLKTSVTAAVDTKNIKDVDKFLNHILFKLAMTVQEYKEE